MQHPHLVHGTATALPLPAASVHCIVTSPPYWGLRLYHGVAPTLWGGDPDCSHSFCAPLPHGRRGTPGVSGTGGNLSPSLDADGTGAGAGDGGRSCGRCGGWWGLLGGEPLHDCLGWARRELPCALCYVCHLRRVARELWRVLRDDGTLWLNLGDSMATGAGEGNIPGSGGQGQRWKRGNQDHWQPNRLRVPGLKPKDMAGIPWRVALALQADGWVLRADIVWQKGNTMPESAVDRPARSYEHVFLLTKSPRYFYDDAAWHEPAVGAENPEGLRRGRDVWTINTTPTSVAHFATMPPALAERCILLGTSAAGCCLRCQAPLGRTIQRIHTLDGGAVERLPPLRNTDKSSPSSRTGVRHDRPRRLCVPIGWQPTCACQASVTPCVVLDPFAGSGTVPLVAVQQGRVGIGIDASWTYVREVAFARTGLEDVVAWAGGLTPRGDNHSDLPLFGARC